MVFSAALLSLAVMLQAPDPPPQAPDTPPPYSLEGVRKAASRQDRPASEPGPVERHVSQYRLSVDTQQLTSGPCSQLVIVCQPAWRVGGAATWNDQFLAMTNPVLASPLVAPPGNGDRAVGAATSLGFALAFQGVAHLVHKAVTNKRDGKVKKIRAEIAAELAAIERANQAAREKEAESNPRK